MKWLPYALLAFLAFLAPGVASSVSPAAPADGTIVEEEPVALVARFADQVDCLRIKYSSDGLKVVGFVLKPRGFQGKLPVLIYNRGGNRDYGMISRGQIEFSLASLAAQNYVVLASQYRGVDGGEGEEHFGGDDVNDVLNLIPLARSLPYADVEKLVMLGDSRGGLMTYLAIKSGAPIKAAAVVGAPSDLEDSYWGRDAMGKVLDELIGGAPWQKSQEYRDRSALYWPEKLTVPLLILHGEFDWRVPCAQSERLAERLLRLGLPHELVLFPAGDHGLSRFRNERNRLILEWFSKHLT